MNNAYREELLKSNLSKEEMSLAFRKALSTENLITSEDTAIIFYDMDFLKERITDLKNLFPKQLYMLLLQRRTL